MRLTIALGALLATALAGSPAQAARGANTLPAEPSTVDQAAADADPDDVEGAETGAAPGGTADDTRATSRKRGNSGDDDSDADATDDREGDEDEDDVDEDEGDEGDEGDTDEEEDGDEEDENEDEADQNEDADGDEADEDGPIVVDPAPPVITGPGTDVPAPPAAPVPSSDPAPPVPDRTATAPGAPRIGAARAGAGHATVRWT
ncbi:MAG TPA: hypothetical protein VF657_26540, partial [Actinoplanes sp.]